MEIIYSRVVKLDEFIENYQFLLESTTSTFFEIDEQNEQRMNNILKELIGRGIDPLLYLSYCFTRRSFIRPGELLSYVTSFNPRGLDRPIEGFQKKIEQAIEGLKNWSSSHLEFFMLNQSDPRLVVTDPEVRFMIVNQIDLKYRSRYWRKILVMMFLFEFTKVTPKILQERWIPFLVGDVR